MNQQKSQIIVVGGKRDAGSAYRYRNGFDKTNALGARKYEHNAGYGFADEIDNTNPNPKLTEWGRKYATAQSSTWGKSVPRVWSMPANSNLPLLSNSNNNNNMYNSNSNNNDDAWQSSQQSVSAAPSWVTKKLNKYRKSQTNKWQSEPYSSNSNDEAWQNVSAAPQWVSKKLNSYRKRQNNKWQNNPYSSNSNSNNNSNSNGNSNSWQESDSD